MIALVVLCPAVLPILGTMLELDRGPAPKLAGAIGVVSKKAFDGVVKGVGEFRNRLKIEANLRRRVSRPTRRRKSRT